MDLATIELPRAEARQKFLEYRRAVRERHNAEDEQIMRGYREMAKGTPLIHLQQTVVAGGTTTVHVPREGYIQVLREGEPSHVEAVADVWLAFRLHDDAAVLADAARPAPLRVRTSDR